MSSTVLLSTSLLLLTIVPFAHGIPFAHPGTSKVIRTVTGNEVPLSILLSYGDRFKVGDPSVLLFDVDSELQIKGHGLDIDLKSVTAPSRPLINEDVTLVVNGKSVDFSGEDAGYIRQGAKYSVAHTVQGEVLGVWGPGLSLSPVHTVHHPGIFINLAHRPYSPLARTDGGEADGVETEDGLHLFGNDVESIIGDTVDVTQEGESSRSVVRQAASCASRTAKYAVSVATVSDRGMCAKYGDSFTHTANVILAAMELATVPYDTQTCLTLRTTYIELTCTDEVEDPWGGIRTSESILRTFRETFTAERPNVSRDVAYFLPSYFDDTRTSGVAYGATACRRSYAYGWAENLEPVVMAHEIGHNLDCPHTPTGLMKASWRPSDPLVFSNDSIASINAFVDSIKAGSYAAECLLDESTVPAIVPPSATPSPTMSSTPSTSPSQTPIPTSSPTSSPTPSTSLIVSTSPSPSPASKPPGTPGTCASKFRNTAAFKCETLYSTDLTSSSTLLRYRVRQRSNGILFEAQVRTGKDRIEGAGMSVRMTSSGSDVAPQPLQTPGRQTRVFVSMEDVLMKLGQKTCCYSEMWIQMAVNLCGAGNCRTVRTRLTMKLSCEQCLRRYTPASPRRICNRCRN